MGRLTSCLAGDNKVLMCGIEYTPEAREDLKMLKKYDQNEIIDGIREQLRHEPKQETRHRKKLRPNDVADWELRIGRFRVLYNVDDEESIVSVERVGMKVRHSLYVRGERIDLWKP